MAIGCQFVYTRLRLILTFPSRRSPPFTLVTARSPFVCYFFPLFSGYFRKDVHSPPAAPHSRSFRLAPPRFCPHLFHKLRCKRFASSNGVEHYCVQSKIDENDCAVSSAHKGTRRKINLISPGLPLLGVRWKSN